MAIDTVTVSAWGHAQPGDTRSGRVAELERPNSAARRQETGSRTISAAAESTYGHTAPQRSIARRYRTAFDESSSSTGVRDDGHWQNSDLVFGVLAGVDEWLVLGRYLAWACRSFL